MWNCNAFFKHCCWFTVEGFLVHPPPPPSSHLSVVVLSIGFTPVQMTSLTQKPRNGLILTYSIPGSTKTITVCNQWLWFPGSRCALGSNELLNVSVSEFAEAEHGYASMLPFTSNKERDGLKRKIKSKKNCSSRYFHLVSAISESLVTKVNPECILEFVSNASFKNSSFVVF